jgi:hypothetical protein
LYTAGKETLAKQIEEIIVQRMSRERTVPLILKWKEDQSDPHQKESEDNPTPDVTTPDQVNTSEQGTISNFLGYSQHSTPVEASESLQIVDRVCMKDADPVIRIEDKSHVKDADPDAENQESLSQDCNQNNQDSDKETPEMPTPATSGPCVSCRTSSRQKRPPTTKNNDFLW